MLLYRDRVMARVKFVLIFIAFFLVIWGFFEFGKMCYRKHEAHKQAVQQYLDHNPYKYGRDQYVSYLGIVGVIVDMRGHYCGKFGKFYKIRFPKDSTWSDNDVFTTEWCRENALREVRYRERSIR